MRRFPEDISFKYPWRSYQARVLDNLEYHLDNHKLHVIAPPGSGKTVLGLEVMLRINKPTLILAPSIAIKQQWIDRFCELFLQVETKPDWISTDIYNPSFVTVCTYQGLYAAFNNTIEKEEEEEFDTEEDSIENKSSNKEQQSKIIKVLKKKGIKTIIADEAHHLKNAWWTAITALVDEIDPKVVGLTATPPYDVSMAEWRRYIALNGEVDEEISVPELVKDYDLCPHQDFIYFNVPASSEREALLKSRNKIYELYQKLIEEQAMLEELSSSQLLIDPENHLNWIYDNTEHFFACLVYIHHFDVELAKSKLYILGNTDIEIPPLNFVWMEKVIQFYSAKGSGFFENEEEHKEEVTKLFNRLRHYGAMNQGQVQFSNNTKQNDLLTSSVNKLESIHEIIKLEYSMLQSSLRLVVLADFIYKEYHVSTAINDIEISKLGVLPIFEYLRRTPISTELKMGVLSGTLIIIPITAVPLLLELSVTAIGKEIICKPIAYDSNYVEVVVSDSTRHQVVALITQLFEKGEIEVLIGTKALLGEGWDAPSINSLILASYVGSFVMSNQMRGRAIRSLKNDPNKTSNIWHLVSIDPYVENGGTDISFLTRRFRGFVGVSNDAVLEDVEISNGTSRLRLPLHLDSIEAIKEQNDRSFLLARQRDLLHKRWQIGIAKGTSLINAIEAPFIERNKRETASEVESLYTRKTIEASIFSLVGVVSLYFFNQIFDLIWTSLISGGLTMKRIIWVLVNGGIFGFIFKFGKQGIKTLKIARSYRDVSHDLFPIARTLLKTLCHFGLIKTEYKSFTIIGNVSFVGEVNFALKGGSIIERKLFIKSLKEILSPVENPRYVIERKSFVAFYGTSSDYHAVPECIGVNQKRVQYFEAEWKASVGKCNIIYTRTPEGRKELLRTRLLAVANLLSDQPILEEDVWK